MDAVYEQHEELMSKVVHTAVFVDYLFRLGVALDHLIAFGEWELTYEGVLLDCDRGVVKLQSLVVTLYQAAIINAGEYYLPAGIDDRVVQRYLKMRAGK